MKIEKNIPIPARQKTGKPMSVESKTALKMKPGESVFIPERKMYMRLISALRKANLSYVSRAVDGGWRIWRVDGRTARAKFSPAAEYSNGRIAPTL